MEGEEKCTVITTKPVTTEKQEQLSDNNDEVNGKEHEEEEEQGDGEDEDDDVKCNGIEESEKELDKKNQSESLQQKSVQQHQQQPPQREVSNEVKNNIERTWKEFEDNLALILDNIGSNKTEWNLFWGNMYRQVFTLKTITRTIEYLREPLYHKFEQFLITHVHAQREIILRLEESAEVFLRTYLRKWCDYAIAIKYMHDIFSMHYFWVKEQGVPDIFLYGISVWRDHLYSGALVQQMAQAVVTLLTHVRDGRTDIPHASLIPSLIKNHVVLAPDSTNALELFRTNFVTPFVSSTFAYYKKEAVSIIGEGGANVAKFMRVAEARLDEEIDRLKSYYSSSGDFQCGVFPDVYHALLHSCWSVCESMSTLELSSNSALDLLMEQLLKILHEVLISNNQDVLIHACPTMFVNDQWEDLSRMWRLLSRVEQTPLLEDRLLKHILDVGLTFVEKIETNKKKDVCEYVQGLHGFMIHYRDGVKKYFANHKNFVIILDKGFDTIINKSKSGSRYLAQFTDRMMRTSFGAANDVHVEATLDSVIDILNYLQDKDLFQAFYVHYLAKRLLETERSTESDHERLMLAKLKTNRGMSFTSKMERMFKDIALSADISLDFSNWQKCAAPSSSTSLSTSHSMPFMAELVPTTVTNGAWPHTVLQYGTSPLECLLPPEVESSWSLFKVYYLAKYSGRRLTFLSHLGSAEVKVRLGGKEYIATMSTFAMCLLSLFNYTDSLTYEDIKATSNIPAHFLESTLKSLISPLSLPTPSTKKAKKGKPKIVPQLLLLESNLNNTVDNNSNMDIDNYNNNTNTNNNNNNNSSNNNNNNNNNNKNNKEGEPQSEFDDNSVFRVNDAFVCASKRFKVRVVQWERKAREDQASTDTEERLKKERELVVDALIVRIMKSRRKLHHNLLVQEVVSQSSARFVPPLNVIKTRIQILIEREFIARCSDDMNTYVYIE